jgi:hypothetical protein
MQTARPEPRTAVVGQLRDSAVLLAGLYGATLGLVAAAWLGAELVDRSFSNVTHDPLAVAKEPFYVGALSNVGVLVWWTAAVACAVTAAVLWRSRRDVAAPLGAAGLLAAALTADDLFMVHDVILPDYLHVPEPVTYAAYVAAATAFAVAYRTFLSRTRWALLALVLLFFACSVVIDWLVSDEREEQLAGVEDVFKLFGIVTWAAYWIPLALGSLRASTEAGARG